MSKLSALLNPAPGLNQPAEGGDGLPKGGSNHDRHPSLTSPLEALAIAATNSPPSLSPTDLTTAPLTSATAHQRTFSNSSSRPDSSHYSLPMPNALNLAQPPSSSPYDHSIHHNGDSNGRILSDIVDGGSRELPPLRRSFPNENDHDSSGTVPSGESYVPREQHDFVGETQSHQLPSLKAALSVDHEFGLTPYGSEHPRPHDGAMKAVEADAISCRDLQYGTRSEVTMEMVNESTNAAEPNHDVAASIHSPLDAVDNVIQKVDSTEATLPAVEVKREDIAQDVAINGPSSPPFKGIPSNLQRTASRKRPAPKTDKKKGTATTVRKPAAKKRKIDSDSLSATPFSQRSETPSSSRASKTPVPRNRKQSSTTPTQSSPPPSIRDMETLDDEDVDDDTELFCICRKPDDHTWMIGCDGGCEDWFHGRCVGINERDGNLIDKYICPNCKDNGLGQTTWKPMCRLETCREPARVTGTKPSKYCSNEHGEEYMALRALGKDSKRNESNKASAARKRRKDNLADHTANGDDGPPVVDEIDDQVYLRGGLLRPPELKALASGVTSLCDFKALGEGVLSPPQTASPDSAHSKQHRLKGIYTSEETTQLSDIASRKAELKRQRALLDDRERFLGLIKTRAKTVLEDLKKRDGVKDICGFDFRLSWSDEEFDAWRSSGEGQKALESGVLSAPLPEPLEDEVERGEKTANGGVEEVGKGVCQKKRCERHKKWYQLQQQEIAFEKEQGRQAMRKLEEEEKGLGERATLRFLENSTGGEEPEDSGHTAVADTGGIEN